MLPLILPLLAILLFGIGTMMEIQEENKKEWIRVSKKACFDISLQVVPMRSNIPANLPIDA